MAADRELRLAADVGGTNLRMGLVEIAGGKVHLQHVEVMATPAGRELTDSLASYWCRQGAPTLGSVAVCVAGPVDGSGLQASARLTNTDLAVSAQGIAHDHPVAAFYQELRAFRIYDGASEVHRAAIAQRTLRQQRSGA